MKQGFVLLVLLACWGCGGGSGIETSGGNNGPKVFSSGQKVAFQAGIPSSAWEKFKRGERWVRF